MFAFLIIQYVFFSIIIFFVLMRTIRKEQDITAEDLIYGILLSLMPFINLKVLWDYLEMKDRVIFKKERHQ